MAAAAVTTPSDEGLENPRLAILLAMAMFVLVACFRLYGQSWVGLVFYTFSRA